jgi:hypothetical protein
MERNKKNSRVENFQPWSYQMEQGDTLRVMKFNHSLGSYAKFKNTWVHTFSPPYVVMTCNLIMYLDKFIIENIIIIHSLYNIIVGTDLTVWGSNSGKDNWFLFRQKELCLMKNELERMWKEAVIGHSRL